MLFFFISVSFQPVFTINSKSSKDNIKNQNDCGCKTVSITHYILFERLLNKLEIYTKKLSSLFKDNEEIKTNYNSLFKEISKIKSKTKTLNNYPVYLCLILLLHISSLTARAEIICTFLFNIGISIIFIKIFYFQLYIRILYFLEIYDDLDCPNLYPFSTFNLLSMHKEGKKIKNN